MASVRRYIFYIFSKLKTKNMAFNSLVFFLLYLGIVLVYEFLDQRENKNKIYFYIMKY